LGSTFNPWQLSSTGTGSVSGGTLSAAGEEPIQFIAGNNITITSNTASTPKTITFSAAGGGGGGGGSSVGTGITLGTPTDSSFADGLLSFTPTTTVTDAIDEVNEILNKLAPSKPPNLSAITIDLASKYSAIESSSGTTRNFVTDDTTPESSNASNFYDGDAGTLSAELNNSTTGSVKTLTTADDTSTTGNLSISSDIDAYANQAGKEGFWKQLTAKVLVAPGNALSTKGPHTMRLIHSNTGSTNTVTFYLDNPVSPSITNTSFSLGGASSNYVSGVPTISANQTFTVSFTINNAVKRFYRSGNIAEVSGNILSNSVPHTLSGVQTEDGAVVVSGKTCTVGTSKYNETNALTITPYNSKSSSGTTGTITLTNVRVDTVSSEAGRLVAGAGQYPTTGYGSAYDSTQSLRTSYTEELQLLNGKYQRPANVNYSSNSPQAGPDYSTGMGSTYRYFLYQHTSALSSASSFTLTINSTEGNFTADSNKITPAIQIYAKVEGATGWIDCNSPFQLNTSPSTNGAAAMDAGSAATTSAGNAKKVTFGLTSRSGTLYIRIGLPSGSDKKFAGVSISSIV